MKLVLATNNKDKIREIGRMLADLDIDILTSNDFENFPDIEETGTTLEANAILKSEGIFKFTGLPSLADDSGLEVDALGGRPGVYSSRFAGENVTYDDNNRKLLEELTGVPWDKRTARFRTVIAITLADGLTQTVAGTVDGIITEEKRTTGQGFGYDPVFYYPPLDKTFAELPLEEKNKISHRGKALVKAVEVIKKHLARV